MTNKEALKLSLMTLERDNLKVGNIYVNYDIQKALIKLVKKKLQKIEKKKWVGLTEEEIFTSWKHYADIAREVEAKLKEKNAKAKES